MDLNKLRTCSEETTSTGNITDADRQIVNTVFSKLAAIFPAWKQAFDGPEGIREAKRTWLEAFMENEINTLEQINRGLVEAKKSTNPFLPSVGQFIEWCRVKYVHPSHQQFVALEFDEGEKVDPQKIQDFINEF